MADLLVAAKNGDEIAFAELTEPLRREIHLHCYRMLGSLADADDALQDALLRAWKQLASFEPRAPFRAWLYRIATNVCLTMLDRRARRGEIDLTLITEEGEPMALEPYPDHLLDELPEPAAESRESVELAFVAAVQYLPPRQRATLLLRDVIGYSGTEVAGMLATSVAGVNSALQRARATLDDHRAHGVIARDHSRVDTATEQQLIASLVESWRRADIPAFVSLLTDDALLAMPPKAEHYIGRDAIAGFFAQRAELIPLSKFRVVPVRANRQPALAIYRRDGDRGPWEAHGVVVLALTPYGIASLTRFGDLNLFPRFGVPLALDEMTAF
jgi:RNA polymerase sigma-70 factor (ECF subfamily)